MNIVALAEYSESFSESEQLATSAVASEFNEDESSEDYMN